MGPRGEDAGWYRQLNVEVQDLADQLLVFPEHKWSRVVKMAHVIAELSPRLRVQDNAMAACALFRGSPRPGYVLSRSWERALSVWNGGPRLRNGGDKLKTARSGGLKVEAFATAILAPASPWWMTEWYHVVIDTWMLRWAGVVPNYVKRKGGYETVARLVIKEARDRDQDVHETQAAIWAEVQREHGKVPRAFPLRETWNGNAEADAEEAGEEHKENER